MQWSLGSGSSTAPSTREVASRNRVRLVQEGDGDGLFEETFKSHTDSKPKGPQGIGFDVAFPGSQHVYGIPQHATSLALKATVGVI